MDLQMRLWGDDDRVDIRFAKQEQGIVRVRSGEVGRLASDSRLIDKFFVLAHPNYWVAKRYDCLVKALKSSRTVHVGSTVIRMPDGAPMSELSRHGAALSKQVVARENKPKPAKREPKPRIKREPKPRKEMAQGSPKEPRRPMSPRPPRPIKEQEPTKLPRVKAPKPVRVYADRTLQYAARDSKLRKLFESGVASRDMLRELDMWPRTMYAAIKRLGLKRDRVEIERHTKDSPGQRFGSLVLMERKSIGSRRHKWLCRCDCGKEVLKERHQFAAAKSPSCGCAILAVKPGHRYGMLEAIRRVDNTLDGRVVWECRCDCGATKPIATNLLRSGDAKSCGCLVRKLCAELNKAGRRNVA